MQAGFKQLKKLKKIKKRHKNRGYFMKRILTLLNEKNHYLEKFYSLNESELNRFVLGQFETLENFYQSREKMLEIIRYIDSQIEAARIDNDSTNNAAMSAEIKKEARECLAIKDQYVNRIIEQDLKVLSCIESAKSEIIRELQDIRKNRKAVSGYKSPSFKQRLDEEV